MKFGGELLEDPERLAALVEAVATAAHRAAPLVIVHGGGKEIDAALAAAGIQKRQVDGLRITDDATLAVVVSVLGGTVNTRFVAALNAAGVPAVGLTGADGFIGLSTRAAAHICTDGGTTDLGFVGMPVDRSNVRLLSTLVDDGFVPVVASLGVGDDGQIYNVNADTLAGHLAARLGARRLVVAGTTAGVLGANGETVRLLEAQETASMVTSGTATAGMIAKLHACERAIAGGVDDVVIIDGRDGSAIAAAAAGDLPPASTRVIGTAALSAPRSGE
jgi:acetylglutamate kinase